MVRNNDLIYYYDSYGVAPDGELSKISPGIRYELHENQRALTRLLRTIPSGLLSDTTASSFKSTVQVSTLAVVGWKCQHLRSLGGSVCIFKGFTLKDFQDRMESLKEQYHTSFDKLVCSLWSSL